MHKVTIVAPSHRLRRLQPVNQTFNVIDVTLGAGIPLPGAETQRQVLTSSACGICGTTSIDQVRQWLRSEDVVMAPGVYAPTQLVYQAYSGWTSITGRGRLTETEFRHRMEAIGYPAHERPGGLVFYKGVRTREMRVTGAEVQVNQQF